MRRVTLAVAILAHALVLGPTQTEAATSPVKTAIQSGSAALQAGAYESAVQEFTKALASKKLDGPTTAVTLLNRGLALQQMRQFVEAISDYDRALQERKLAPTTRAVALYNRGLANRKLYRTTLALEDFTNALILNPKFAQAFNSRANVLRELGYYTTAIQDYDAAVRYKHPQPHIPLYGKALSHAALRNLAAAKDALKRALHIQPAYAPAKKLLARITTVPKPDTAEKAETLVADATPDPETTGTVDQSTTVVVKNNLPWAPAPKKIITTPSDSETREVLITDNETAETIIANSSISPLNQSDIVARPTAAPADAVTQNVVPSETTEDLSLRSKVATDRALESVPEPGTEVSDLPAPGKGDRQDEEAEGVTTPTRVAAAELPPVMIQDREDVPAMDDYLIQISAQTNPTVARDLWNSMAEKHPDLLGDLTPYIIKVEIDGKGTIYRVRAGGFGDRQAGTSLCGQLKRRRVSCYVTAADR